MDNDMIDNNNNNNEFETNFNDAIFQSGYEFETIDSTVMDGSLVDNDSLDVEDHGTNF